MSALSTDLLARLVLAGVGLERDGEALRFTAPEDAPAELVDAVRRCRDAFLQDLDDAAQRRLWGLPAHQPLSPRIRTILLWLQCERAAFTREDWRVWRACKSVAITAGAPPWIADLFSTEEVARGRRGWRASSQRRAA